MQGRIKHDRMPMGAVDPRPDFLLAHRLYPNRAEPLLWMCWHHHKMMNNCKPGIQQDTCWVRERAAAYYYSRKAAALPMPEVHIVRNRLHMTSHTSLLCGLSAKATMVKNVLGQKYVLAGHGELQPTALHSGSERMSLARIRAC